MSLTAKKLIFFSSILLLFALILFTLYSPISLSLLSKALPFFQVNASDNVVDANFVTSYDSVVYDEVSDPGDIVSIPGEELGDLIEEKDIEPVDEKAVAVLSRHNFTEFIASHLYVMVNFYAPWCYWGQQLEQEYMAAATMLKNTKAVLAKVDCSVEYELARKYTIQVYPSMILFIRGAKKVVYGSSEARTRDVIAFWMKLKMNPHVQTIEEVEDSVSEELAVVPELHGELDFYQTTDANIARLIGIDPEIKRPALFLLQKEPGMNHTHYRFDGEFTGSEISEFVSVYKLPPVITFTVQAAPLVFENPMKQLWLFTPKFSRGVTCTFKEAAMAFKGKLLFVHVETGCGDVGRILSYQFGVTEDSSRAVAYTPTEHSKKHIYTGELTLSGITSFANQFLEGKLTDLQDVRSDTLQLLAHVHTADSTGGSYV